MASQLPPTVAQELERIATDLHDMAFDFMEPARSHDEADGRIARVEDLADRLRRTVRGQR